MKTLSPAAYAAIPALALILLPAVAFAGGLDDAGAYQSGGFAGGIFVEAICDLYSLVGGQMGAMMTSAALCTGLIGAAVGGFQNMKAALATGVACFAFTSGVSLYFGSFNCGV